MWCLCLCCYHKLAPIQGWQEGLIQRWKLLQSQLVALHKVSQIPNVRSPRTHPGLPSPTTLEYILQTSTANSILQTNQPLSALTPKFITAKKSLTTTAWAEARATSRVATVLKLSRYNCPNHYPLAPKTLLRSQLQAQSPSWAYWRYNWQQSQRARTTCQPENIKCSHQPWALKMDKATPLPYLGQKCICQFSLIDITCRVLMKLFCGGWYLVNFDLKSNGRLKKKKETTYRHTGDGVKGV